jgi:RNA polymerase sigma-70 factor (ECF subfamily)
LVARVAGGGADGTTGDGATAAREAMEGLLLRCLPAMRAHLRLDRQLGPDEADDVLQGFVADRVLAGNIIAAADARRGRFRTFLLGALDCYCVDRHRRRAARKRAPAGGDAAIASLGTGAPERCVQRYDGRAGGAAPADAFDRAWGRHVLAEAVERMRVACEGPGGARHRAVWEIFHARVLAPALDGAELPDYGDLVGRFGLRSPTQAANLLVTGKRMFARCLRGVVGQYAADEEEIDREIGDLHDVFSRVKG